jgi:hypothetical protein
MKQTFIVSCWAGGGSYLDAVKNGHDHTFYRLGCKRLETAKKYLKEWRKQALELYADACFYKHLTSDDAQYIIEESNEDYPIGDVLENGYIKNL